MTHAMPTLSEVPRIVAGRYEIGQAVGAGSSGTVFVAVDLETGERCAIKIREARNGERPVRFIAEARDMQRLRHPRLVPVLDYGEDEERYWYTMPLYARGCLRDRVKRGGPLGPDKALDWIFQVLEGLHAVHEAGLVHRDVKPHNVLVSDDDHALLADFGLARHVHGGVDYRTRTDQSMGTPNYRAPEQATDAASVDARADIYGVGATLYFLVTAKRPGFLCMVDRDDPVMATVPEPLRDFILKCMALDPANRYPNARSCAVDVAALADHYASDAPVGAAWMKRLDAMSKQGWLDRIWSWMRG
ncbi:MAG: serine/threonine-protein kinase [Myxococcota bacterium]